MWTDVLSIKHGDSGIIFLEGNFFCFLGFHTSDWRMIAWKPVEPFRGRALFSCWTRRGDATEAASALFVASLEKERKGLCKHHGACHDTAENQCK